MIRIRTLNLHGSAVGIVTGAAGGFQILRRVQEAIEVLFFEDTLSNYIPEPKIGWFCFSLGSTFEKLQHFGERILMLFSVLLAQI